MTHAGDEDGCVNKVSAEDVARAVGVSRAAVSQIVNGRGERFAADTRTRVMAAAKELGYQPSAAGRSLRRGISDIVVAVIPNITFGSNLQDIIDQLTADAAEHGLFLVVRYSPAADPSFDRFITALRPAAVLPLAPLSEAHRQILTSRDTLVVERSQPWDAGHDVVGVLQAEHLLGRGYRHLAYAHLADRREGTYGSARLAGVRTFCQANGLPNPLVLTTPIDTQAAAEQLRGLPASIGVACYNDDVALTLLAASRVLGIEVPGRLGLIGVDRIPLGQIDPPVLTSLEYDPIDIAHRLRDHVLIALGLEIPAGDHSATPYRVSQGATT